MVEKALMYKAAMYSLKSMLFYQLALLSNNLLLMSYLSRIYLESCFSWLWGGMQKTLRKRIKQAKEKHWEMKTKNNEEYKETHLTPMNILGFYLLYIKNCIWLRNIVWNKVVYTIAFYLQFFMSCRIFGTRQWYTKVQYM